MFDDPALDEEAPPAYNFAQQEFDQKLALAAERSLAISNAAAAPNGTTEEELWEEWDEAKFEAAVRQSQQEKAPVVDNNGASSSRPLPGVPQPTAPLEIQPLNINKKSRQSMSPVKERPSWYDEAQLSPGAPSAPAQVVEPPASRRLSAQSRTSTQSRVSNGDRYRDAQRRESQQSLGEYLQDDEDRSMPPPPFVPYDNSLDGPPYEASVAEHRLSYQQQPDPSSPAPSPPQSPIQPDSRFLANPNRLTYPAYPAQTSRRPSPRVSPRPSSEYPRSFNKFSNPAAPRVGFNPNAAYSNPRSPLPDTSAESYLPDPASLYHSSVASLMTPQRPRQRTMGPRTSQASFDTMSLHSLQEAPNPSYPSQQFHVPQRVLVGSTPAPQPAQRPMPQPTHMPGYPQGMLNTQPTVPTHQPQPRWAVSEAQIQQDVFYGR